MGRLTPVLLQIRHLFFKSFSLFSWTDLGEFVSVLPVVAIAELLVFVCLSAGLRGGLVTATPKCEHDRCDVRPFTDAGRLSDGLRPTLPVLCRDQRQPSTQQPRHLLPGAWSDATQPSPLSRQLWSHRRKPLPSYPCVNIPCCARSHPLNTYC